jgi:hypothetical protein
MSEQYKLYGVACSLYTAKARSYLRKQNIDFVELGPNHPSYRSDILPQIGRMIVPVIQAPDGQIVQDGSDIIDHFEKNNLATVSAYSDNKVMGAIGFLFELFGGEGLLRPAMHFRWDYDVENLSFLKSEFSPFGPSSAIAEQTFEFASGRMRQAKLFFGATVESKDLIIESYKEFLGLLEEHFTWHPYLLGAKASLGDYALMGPLYGHLYRDPAPAMIMRQNAPRVARWAESMNTSNEYWADHNNTDNVVYADTIPDTLKALMRFISEEYLPEIIAHVNYANKWLQQHADIEVGTNGMDKAAERVIGLCEFNWRGIDLTTAVMPYRFYLLQRLQDCYDEANSGEQRQLQQLFSETGLSGLLAMRTLRRVERNNHLEVWGPLLTV